MLFFLHITSDNLMEIKNYRVFSLWASNDVIGNIIVDTTVI